MLGSGEVLREPYSQYKSWFDGENAARLHRKTAEAEAFFRKTGITFNVYGQEDADERLIPFDVVPRILSAHEWRKLSRGIEQRVRAINAFLYDIYHRQEILRAGRVPVSLIAENAAFLPQMVGVDPPGGIYTHIIGTDIVRTGDDEFFVLEDNASALHRACRTCWKTARRCCRCFRRYFRASACSRSAIIRRTCAALWPHARRVSAKAGPVVAVLTPWHP